MADCCLIKKVATVEVYENKNEVRAYGFMAGDRNTPVMEVRFKHLWGEDNLSTCKLRWIIVDDVGSLLVGEVPIQSDNTALINLPNELFTGERRMKVQLTVASCDGERILNLQQFTDLKVINNLATNEVVEPVYQMLINQLYDESQKYLNELETSYTNKYGSLEGLYLSARSSLENYLVNAENGGNAQFVQGYGPSNFNRVENTIAELQASSKYKLGDVVEVLGYYTAGDGANHNRKIEQTDDGSGVQLANGFWANIVHNGEVNVSWFGALEYNRVTDTLIKVSKNKNINYITIDKEYVIDGELEVDVFKIKYIGTGKLSANNRDLFLEKEVVQEFKQGSIDLSCLVSENMQRTRQAIQEKKHIKIVLFGDSISEGTDLSNYRILPGRQVPYGINNPDNLSSLARVIFETILQNVPSDVKIDLYNRAIPGTNYSNTTTPWNVVNENVFVGREKCEPGKIWKDTVLDLDPDLIIHSFGMNHTSKNYVQQFKTHWLDYLEAKGILGVDQVILTTPNPNYDDITSVGYGDYRQYILNADKIALAQLQRQMARLLNWSVIDAAKNNTVLRYGLDFTNYTTSNSSIPLSPNGTDTNFTINSNSNLKLISQHKLLHFVYKFNISNKADFSLLNGETVITYNSTNDTFEVAGIIGLYTRYITNAGVVNGSKIKIEYTNSGIVVWVDDVVRGVCDIPIPLAVDEVEFRNMSSLNITLSNSEVYMPIYQRFSSKYTSFECFGRYGIDESADDIYGGGVNHPSSLMLISIYRNSVRDFFSKIRNIDKFEKTSSFNNVGDWVYLGKIRTDFGYERQTKLSNYSIYPENIKKLEIQLNESGNIVNYINTFDNSFWITPKGELYSIVSNPLDFSEIEALGNVVLYNKNVGKNPQIGSAVELQKTSQLLNKYI